MKNAHLGCYTNNILAIVLHSLHQVPGIIHGSLLRISDWTYFNPWGQGFLILLFLFSGYFISFISFVSLICLFYWTKNIGFFSTTKPIKMVFKTVQFFREPSSSWKKTWLTMVCISWEGIYTILAQTILLPEYRGLKIQNYTTRLFKRHMDSNIG